MPTNLPPDDEDKLGEKVDEKLPSKKDITIRGVTVANYNKLRYLAFFWGDIPLGEAFDKTVDLIFYCETEAPGAIFERESDLIEFLTYDYSTTPQEATEQIVSRFLQAFALGQIPDKNISRKPKGGRPKKKKPTEKGQIIKPESDDL